MKNLPVLSFLNEKNQKFNDKKTIIGTLFDILDRSLRNMVI